jgi:hypothetical protein
VDDAREALFAVRLLQPDASLAEGAEALRVLGEAPAEPIRFAAQPWHRIWKSWRRPSLRPEVVEGALSATYDEETLAKVLASKVATYPSPWGAITYELRLETAIWGVYFPLKVRHDVLAGWLIAHPELTFLWHWAGSTSMGLDRGEAALRLTEIAAELTGDWKELYHQSRILQNAGHGQAALDVGKRAVDAAVRRAGSDQFGYVGNWTARLHLGQGGQGNARKARALLDEVEELTGVNTRWDHWRSRAEAARTLDDTDALPALEAKTNRLREDAVARMCEKAEVPLPGARRR